MSELSAEDMATIQKIITPQIDQVNKTVMLGVDTMIREGERNRQTTVRIFERMDKQDEMLVRIDERVNTANSEKQETKTDKQFSKGQILTIIGVVSVVAMWLLDKFHVFG